MKKKIDGFLKEYWFAEDVNEICECVKELPHQEHLYTVVFHALNLAMDTPKEKNRNQTAEALTKLHVQKLITKAHFERGTKECLDLVPDIIIDMPNAGKFVGGALGQLVVTNCISLATIVNSCMSKELVESGHGAKLMAALLGKLQKTSVDSAIAAVKEAKLDAKSLLRRDTLEQWMKYNNLD